jgi:hypothetical protein
MYRLIDVPNLTPAEECQQLKAACNVAERLGDKQFLLKCYIRLHEIEDGY